MRCAICSSKMETKTVQSVNIDICPRCGGVWLDEGEMEKLTGLDPSSSRELKCTVCDIPMSTKMINDVEIDYCQICNSVWLDRGELDKLSGKEPRSVLYDYMNKKYYTKPKGD